MPINVRVLVDNYCLICSGNGRQIRTVHNPAAWNPIPSTAPLTLAVPDLPPLGFIYLVAWSDCALPAYQGVQSDGTSTQQINGQGLLASVGFRPLTSSGDPTWRVLATGTRPLAGNAPTIDNINAAMANAPRWETPAVSGVISTRAGARNPVSRPTGSFTGQWVWRDSFNGRVDPGNLRDARNLEAPFWPGFDHGEYLIFRIPAPLDTTVNLDLEFQLNRPKSATDTLDDSLVVGKKAKAIAGLLDLAAYIAATQPSCVTISGHTSAEGSLVDNDALSKRRANSVASWLASKSGFSAASFDAQGFGSTRPKFMPETLPQNRRVEVSFTR